MARKLRKDDSRKLTELRKNLRAVRNAIAELQTSERDLDLKIKNLKKRIDMLNYDPYRHEPGSRKP
jgi:phage shock protein A